MANVYNGVVQRVAQDGRVFASGAQMMGAIDREGHRLAARGQPVGEVRPDGGVFDLRHQYVGYVATAAGAPPGAKGWSSPAPPAPARRP